MTNLASRLKRLRVEPATLLVAAVVYGGFAGLTWFFNDLPLLLSVPLGGALIAFHGSLQHETVHGHPFTSRRLNALLGSPPLSLWIPYRLYRSTHLFHHRFEGQALTDPRYDPESYYVSSESFARLAPWSKALLIANTTLVGRLVLGPPISIVRFWWSEARELLSGARDAWQTWLSHLVGVALVVFWVVSICKISLAAYLLCFVYPGTALTMLRSFAEHRANADPSKRTAVVEANPLISTIFLYNNYHVVHHVNPSLPWYRIEAAWRDMKARAKDAPVRQVGMVYSGGYLEVLRRYAFRPVIELEYPLTRQADSAPGPAMDHATG